MSTTLLITAAALASVFGVPQIRRHAITRWVMPFAAKQLPTIGETERIALEAGTVWWDGDLFSGSPNWNKLLAMKVKGLTAEEQAFLDGPVEKLCQMVDDNDIAQRRDLSPTVWTFLKKNKFFGMIIPKEHGGLGFSAAAHAAVVTKISSVSLTTAVTVMVPNSLGPGELLLHYGTPAQQKHYLPRLAVGQEIPCFGLTEPHAGSDAANGRSYGIVCWSTHKGVKTLGLKLTFSKRYITLAPIASVVGLAFRLYDPEHLLGDEFGGKEDLGITLALVPRNTKGLNIGKRHDPMGAPFQNGPVSGDGMFIPLDCIIGGKKQIGQGWRMLMECLSAGRGISLPSLSIGAAQLSTRACSAYALVREQFGMPIGKFEGVRERLARLAASTYTMSATGRFTASAVDAGEKPSVGSAIAKAYLTEGMRVALDDGMDIMAGAAICKGPHNILGRAYSAVPIGITVEGANILTRSLIVFGQGAIRCHPYLQAEVEALQTRNLAKLDRALFGHVAHVMLNGVRAFTRNLTRGKLVRVPNNPYSRYYQHLSRLSASFALVADVGLLTLGGALKRKEYLSGRYADAFAALYLASATLKQAHDTNYNRLERPLIEYSLTLHLYQAEQALKGVLENLGSNRFTKLVACKARIVAFPLGFWCKPPSDAQTDAVVDALLEHATGIRESLTPSIFVPEKNKPGLGLLDDAYHQTVYTAASRKKLAQAVKAKQIQSKKPEDQLAEAVEIGLLTNAEAKALFNAAMARDAAVQVTAFTVAEHAELK